MLIPYAYSFENCALSQRMQTWNILRNISNIAHTRYVAFDSDSFGHSLEQEVDEV